jgi:cysteine-rich repeat protein
VKNLTYSASKSVPRSAGWARLLGALIVGSMCFAAACGSDSPGPGADASTDASADASADSGSAADTGVDGATDSGTGGGDAAADDRGFTDAGLPPDCGDAITQRSLGETCDDGNLVSGDGCDQFCQVEPQELDLSSTSTVGLRRRTFVGEGANSQLGYMAVGDVTGDGRPEFFAGARSVPGGARGILYAYETGPDFFDVRTSSPVVSSTVASGSLFQILGEEVNDEFGSGALPGTFVADVTGDGVGDLVASASQADGDGNTVVNAGEIYVFPGGQGLAAAGVVNLANTSSSGLVLAQIQGPEANAQAHAIAVGDTNNDGVADLVIGAPRADGGAGRVYVVLGGATLAGKIDLADGIADARIFAVFQGGTADNVGAVGDRLGECLGAVAQIGGSSVLDLVIGAPTRDTVAGSGVAAGGDRAGVVYGFFGPLTRRVYDVGSALGGNTVTWLSGDIFAIAGTSVAVGNMTGSAANEVMIGGRQILNRSVDLALDPPPSWQRGGVQIWRGPIGQGVLDGPAGVFSRNRVYGAEFGDANGSNIAVGDMNGDGLVDLVASSGNADGPANARANAGETTVILGKASLPPVIDLALVRGALFVTGPLGNSQIGGRKQTSILADLDGDGKDDLCVGAWGSTVATAECIKSPW